MEDKYRTVQERWLRRKHSTVTAKISRYESHGKAINTLFSFQFLKVLMTAWPRFLTMGTKVGFPNTLNLANEKLLCYAF